MRVVEFQQFDVGVIYFKSIKIFFSCRFFFGWSGGFHDKIEFIRDQREINIIMWITVVLFTIFSTFHTQ
jgi:hypothetical protein